MRTIIELDSNEIKEAIAEKYGCAVWQIDLRTKKEPALYGMGDAFAYTTIARIDKDRTSNRVDVTNLNVSGPALTICAESPTNTVQI